MKRSPLTGSFTFTEIVQLNSNSTQFDQYCHKTPNLFIELMTPGNKTKGRPHSTLNTFLIFSQYVDNTTLQHQSKQFKIRRCWSLHHLVTPIPTPPQFTHQLLVLEWIRWCSSRLTVLTTATSKKIFFRTISPCFTETVGDGDKKTKSRAIRWADEAFAAKQRNGQVSPWWVRGGWREVGKEKCQRELARLRLRPERSS